MKLTFLEMLTAVSDSFFRAVIRFWDNRFTRQDPIAKVYFEEVLFLRRENEEFRNFILSNIAVANSSENLTGSDSIDEEMIGRPVETLAQTRRRLEVESFKKWTILVQKTREAKLKAEQEDKKPTEEMEKEILGVSN